MTTKSFIRRAEQLLAGVRDAREKKRRARQLARDAQQRGRNEIRTMQALKDDEARARDIVRSPHARRWTQYLGAGIFLYAVDVGVQIWTYAKLTLLSYSGDVVAGGVTAGVLAAVVTLINNLFVIDTYSEPVTRRRLRLLTGVGIGVALAGAIAFRVIGTLGGHNATAIIRTVGWVPFAAMCLGLPLACASISALGFYYRDARRAINRLSDSVVRLKDLAALYYRLESVPEPDATAVEVEAEVIPAWLDAAGELDVFGTPIAAALRRTEGALLTGTPATPREAPVFASTSTSARKQRGRPRGSKKHPTIPNPEPIQGSFTIPDPDDDGNGNGGGKLIPPAARGLAVLACLLLSCKAMAAPCIVGIDGTMSVDAEQLAAARDFVASTVVDLATAFKCDTITTSIVLDQGRWTPRRRITVPSNPTTPDCSSVRYKPASDVEKLYGTWTGVTDENNREAQAACKSAHEVAVRDYRQLEQRFEQEFAAGLTVREARADVWSPIFSWLVGAVNGNETPSLVVLIGDGLENPPWSKPLPHIAVPVGTTVIFLLVPPRPSYRDPHRALNDVEVWRRVMPGVVIVPAPEVRPGLWADIAARRPS